MIEGLEKAEKNISKKENAFVKSFSKNLILEISEKYSALMELIDIISFDYYPLLKKFNKNLQEDYLVDNPSFSSVYGKYVIEELKGLSATIDTIDLDAPFSKSVEDFNRF
jgi:alpha-L-arabinofuranosidase